MRDYFLAFLKLGGEDFWLIFLMPMLLISLYGILKIIFLKKKGERKKALFPFVQFFLMLFLFLNIYSIALWIISRMNIKTPVDKIIWASDLCAKLDEYIFGVNLSFWMQGEYNPFRWIFDVFSFAMTEAYMLLIIMFSLVLFASLFKKFSIFIKFIFSFIFVVWISFPTWYLFPAYTPANAYFHNTFSHTPSISLQESIESYRPNDNLVVFIEKVKSLYPQRRDDGSIIANISTFPSMHIAWSVITLYFCFIIWKPLLLIIAPHTFLNIISTVFTLQHYGVDVILGIVLAIIAIFCSRFIKYEDSGNEITYFLRNEISNLRRVVSNSYILVKKFFGDNKAYLFRKIDK